MRRLDAELVARGLVRSRAEAQRAIDEGRVLVEGMPALKAARTVSNQVSIKLVDSEASYVSRGAYKLLGALDAFGIDVTGQLVLDAGASTGGFTQVALERGASRVIAVDVGYGQLAWSLRSDPRVTVLERTNIRNLSPDEIDELADTVVADLSFISLSTVLPALSSLVKPSSFVKPSSLGTPNSSAAGGGQMILMVKPQFEAGREVVSATHGVIKDPQIRAQAIEKVAETALALGWVVSGVAASPLPGPKGNVEYFLWLTHTFVDTALPSLENRQQLADRIHHVVAEGPQ